MIWKHPIFACVSPSHDETKSLPIFIDQIHAKTIISPKYPFLIMKTITLVLRIIFQDYQHMNHSPKCVFRQNRVPNIIPQINASLLVNTLLFSAIFLKKRPPRIRCQVCHSKKRHFLSSSPPMSHFVIFDFEHPPPFHIPNSDKL